MPTYSNAVCHHSPRKNSNPEHLLPTLSGRPICIIKIQCDGNFLAVPFCIIKTQCDEKLVLSYSLDGPLLIWCWVPHATFKIKRTGAIVAAECKHQQTCAFR